MKKALSAKKVQQYSPAVKLRGTRIEFIMEADDFGGYVEAMDYNALVARVTELEKALKARRRWK